MPTYFEPISLAASSLPPRVLLVGDALSLPTGLARIARQVCKLMLDLGWHVTQLGTAYDGRPGVPAHVYPIRDDANWGVGDLPFVLAQERPDIVFTIWDPSRCWPLAAYFRRAGDDGKTEWLRHRERWNWTFECPELWGYFPVDGHNVRGGFGGPAAEAVRWYDRVLGYTRYGATVLSRVRGGLPVQALPHLLDDWAKPTEARWLTTQSTGTKLWRSTSPIVGSVMTNQPRKDLGVLFAAYAAILEQEPDAHFWLHTDVETKTWAVSELSAIWLDGKQDRLLVTTKLDDEQLAGLYTLCDVTLLPSLGEGWGYPIVESLACATPVIHTEYAGGAELVPFFGWLSPPVNWRQDGTYAIKRPVLSGKDFALRALAVIQELKTPARRQELSAYCRGAVEHLRTESARVYWEQWLKAGKR